MRIASRAEKAHDLNEKMIETARILVELVSTLQDIHQHIRRTKKSGELLLEGYCTPYVRDGSEDSSAAVYSQMVHKRHRVAKRVPKNGSAKDDYILQTLMCSCFRCCRS